MYSLKRLRRVCQRAREFISCMPNSSPLCLIYERVGLDVFSPRCVCYIVVACCGGCLVLKHPTAMAVCV